MIQSPVLIIGCPRSGTTLLFNILSEVPELWSIGQESGEIIEQWHHPRHKDWHSGALDESDLTPESRTALLQTFEKQAAPGTFWRKMNSFRSWLRQNRIWQEVKRRGQTQEAGAATSSALPQQGLGFMRTLARMRNSLLPRPSDQPIRLLEKTPENCLRLPFLLSLFPDAQIIYLVRNGRSNVNSLIEGWRHPHLFHGYAPPTQLNIPGNGRPDEWAFTLIPDWQELTNAPMEEVSARQWVACNEAVLAHRSKYEGQVPYLTIQQENLIAHPADTLRQIGDFIGVDYKSAFGRYLNTLPQINTVSAPEKEKWRRQNPDAIARIEPLIAPTMARLGYEVTP